MQAIAAVDLQWGIGYQGNLLQRIPADMKFFKEKTIGKVVIMGRETFESLPGKQPLKDRINIVLSRDKSFHHENLIICRSLEELFSQLPKYPWQDLFVIGGESIYRELIPYCTKAYITKINHTYQADKYFINLDQQDSWEIEDMGEPQGYENISYRLLTYSNKAPLGL